MCMFTCVCVHVYVHMGYVYMCMCAYVCIHVYIYRCMCIGVCIDHPPCCHEHWGLLQVQHSPLAPVVYVLFCYVFPCKYANPPGPMGFEASDSGSQDSPQKCYYRAWCALAVLSFFACCCEITPAPWVFRGLILGAMTAQKSVRAASLSGLFPYFSLLSFVAFFVVMFLSCLVLRKASLPQQKCKSACSHHHWGLFSWTPWSKI